MAHINLLDWREALREERKKQFMTWLGLGLVFAAAVVFLAMSYMSSRIEHQTARNNLLRAEIKAVEQKIKEIEELERVKDNLLARMRVIEQLQASRSATVHFFDELVSTLPDGVFLTSVKQTGRNVTIKGVAESNGRVSSYMKNLSQSPWFEKDPRLVVIKTVEQNRIRQSEFELQVKQRTTADTTADGGEVVE